MCEFDFDSKHVKGKENKVVDAFRRKFHITVVRICKVYLRERNVRMLAEYEYYLQVKEGLQQENIENKYECYC